MPTTTNNNAQIRSAIQANHESDRVCLLSLFVAPQQTWILFLSASMVSEGSTSTVTVLPVSVLMKSCQLPPDEYRALDDDDDDDDDEDEDGACT